MQVRITFGDNRELVASQTCNHVIVVERCHETPRNFAKYLIARLMAKNVIDLLELVEVEEQQGIGRDTTLRTSDGGLKIGGESPPIR